MTEFYLIIPFFLIVALAAGFVLCRMMELCSRYTWQGVYMGYCACIFVGLLIALIFKDEIISATSIIISSAPLLRNIRI